MLRQVLQRSSVFGQWRTFAGVPALVAVPPPNSKGVSMLDPFPGVPEPPAYVVPTAPAKTEMATLSNGLRIAAEETPGQTVSIGVYVDSGSVNETPATSGVSHLLEHMAFHATNNRTHFRLVRDMEAIGCSLSASASREQMSYTADALKSFTPEAVELLADTVANPAFHPWEIKQEVEKMKASISDFEANPQSVLLESLHGVAYTGGLANPLVCPKHQLDALDPETVAEFVSENYVPGKMVVAASGCSLSELSAFVEPTLGALPKAAGVPAPKSAYVGGEVRQSAPGNGRAHLCFAFGAPGWRDVKGSVAVTVLTMLMGGGGSFSAGGPGKGMHSRLYSRVLARYAGVDNCTFFNSLYYDTGICGVYASTGGADAKMLADVVTEELLAIAKPGGVTEEEVSRAKQAAQAQVLFNLESKSIISEDVGRQVLTYGARKPASEFLTDVAAITTADVQKLAASLGKSPLTFGAYGDIAGVPRYNELAKRFG